MGISDDVKTGVDGVLNPAWSERKGNVVPTTEDIVLRDGAVNIEATYLYADLANSSVLGQKIKKGVAAKIIRSYLNAATRLLRNYQGEIRSFDGDRVLAIFIGDARTLTQCVLRWRLIGQSMKFCDRSLPLNGLT